MLKGIYGTIDSTVFKFSQDKTDPRHLENWIALHEARILSQVTYHQTTHANGSAMHLKNTFHPSRNPASFIWQFLNPPFPIGEFCLPSFFMLIAPLIRQGRQHGTRVCPDASTRPSATALPGSRVSGALKLDLAI
jgi:hypothetical protein